MISDNLKSVTQRIVSSCEKIGRSEKDITLVCVTKEASIAEIEEVLRLGVTDIGENRTRDALLKYRAIGDRVKWHLVGHLQTNKAKDAVRIFSLIHSVDSERLVGQIDKESKKINKVQDVLIQVNISREESKFGTSPENVLEFLKAISLYPNIKIRGFMTIAPEAENPEIVRQCFRELRELKDELNSVLPGLPSTKAGAGKTQYSILSMGMTSDFEVAIEEGSNMVRIGRAIFSG